MESVVTDGPAGAVVEDGATVVADAGAADVGGAAAWP
jgi:hypothetical protein